ncbi:imidazole glycerol phosphate synthase subunit HisF [Leptospira congkakensis]|uniref:imidazole glycerol-phosphate synthase n=1 Tax=Leptospira congkakensis TaxID=2484932 RepID=A0A4Z1AC75_9LEPT|nr:imidazole glycerol phosphate synthase cyclase subunit [Leptospira congkakensis]TGL90227.1 imidazole glycerol phosphate synthase subunit HisF [Leptospira congkakensis]TGL91233.1 imidazole glycerol phosphate synthase subunit HisF [Leptospira congkakensis]TGL98285.1 imidazole glycerol phosphate synthase subunit HisF [Leptospira congkakensis]
MRVIARLDIKNDSVIKGIHLEGLRKVGDPNILAKRYYEDGIDEILLIDSVASLYGRNNLFDVLRKASQEVFVPITIGGGLRNLDDVSFALDSGADKIAINTAAVERPDLIEEIAKKYGSQCVVASIQAKKKNENDWEVYKETGREKTGIRVSEWVKQLESLGAGEILLTSVDKEGTKSGFDKELSKMVNELVNIPVIVSGGFGEREHLVQLKNVVHPSGIAFASVLHYNVFSSLDLSEMVNQVFC